ncbi:MAG: Nucleotidyltransferase domain protein [Candidatus Methanoperedens nitroreducens]|uniref:Nucleotidyltransferase domain protein n=2 Tax=Candidatus Methanoperedens TaxID=1392997 RepID=A0A0P8AF43_9EURY|nr:MAG: Nucleotidyltransferase domain protein [Candidatus Methanoperedens sp. BLZ1]
MMVSAYIRHGRSAPGIEKVGLYCTRCRRFEIERLMHPAFTDFVRKFPILKHVEIALKPYMDTVRGLYFHGSRARGDHREDSDYDLVLITGKKIDDKLKSELKEHNIQVEVFTLSQLKKQLDLTPSYLLTVLRESVPLIGAELREKLVRKKMNDIALQVELKDCIRQLDYLKMMLKNEPDDFIKARVIHSAILRLRQAYSIKRLYHSDVPELSMEFRKYFNHNFEELYELYRIVRDMVHGDGLNEEELPEKVRTMAKSRLNKLVNSVDSYAKNVLDRIMISEKIAPLNPK